MLLNKGFHREIAGYLYSGAVFGFDTLFDSDRARIGEFDQTHSLRVRRPLWNIWQGRDHQWPEAGDPAESPSP